MLTASRIRDGLDATSKPDGGADGANDDRANGDGASDDADGMSNGASRRSPGPGLRFLLEIVGLASEIFFDGERHRFGRARHQAHAQSCGYNAAKKAPQRTAAID
jgi:hypothetical protein